MAWTLADVKRWLGISGAGFDTDIQALMERALYAVQLELDWYFGASRLASETLDGTGGQELWIRQPPLNTPVVRVRDGVGGTWEVESAANYEVDGRGLFHETEWTAGFRNYRVDYAEGFAAIPGDIEQLLLDLVSGKWRSRTTNPEMQSERIGDYSYTRGDLESSPYWRGVVMRWRRGRI